MKRIAIIGSGISGLYAAYLLHKDYEITIYEKENYLGGHTRTLTITYEKNVEINVDTGFIVFNKKNYPNFTQMINKLDIDIGKSDMSFSVTSNDKNDPEIKYCDLKSYFANKKNLFDLEYYKNIYNISKFNNLSKKALKTIKNDFNNITLGQYLKENGFGQFFIDNYIVPMGSSIWSCKPTQILNFPYLSYVNFMNNHGLLNLSNQPQWHYIKNGSKSYISKLESILDVNFQLNTAVSEVIKTSKGVKVKTLNGENNYDYVIFGSHPDEVLSIGSSLTDDQKNALSGIKYSSNEVVLHKDSTVMPRNRQCWSSWVYKKTKNNLPILSYWMNSLQEIDEKYPIFVSLNPGDQISDDKIINKHTLEHPIFDMSARESQNKIPLIQGKNNNFFCGAYNKYGFHEDGVVSSIKAVEKLREIDI